MQFLNWVLGNLFLAVGSPVKIGWADRIAALASDKYAFVALTTPLKDAVMPYTKSKVAGVPGSERVLQSFLALLRSWIGVERWFYDGKTYADAVDSLRKAHKNDSPSVLNVCRAHEQLQTTSGVVIRIISAIADGSRVDYQTSTASAIGR